jgi:hypothetical protein
MSNFAAKKVDTKSVGFLTKLQNVQIGEVDEDQEGRHDFHLAEYHHSG